MGGASNMSQWTSKVAKGPMQQAHAESVGSANSNGLGHSLLDRIGHTPLVSLGSLTVTRARVEILGKAEWLNPGGSVKDRAAANIVAEARKCGKLGAGK